jgi:hypothetical protein
MKNTNLTVGLTWKFPVLLATLFAVIAYLSSCSKDDSNGPAPTITLSSSTGANNPGGTVTTTVTIDAPEGGKTLTATVNGATDASLPDVDLGGEKSKATDITYTIPANAVVGSTIVIVFTATDTKSQNAAPSTFTVTVQAVPAKQIVEVSGNITTDTHWTADKIYRLNGFVRIGKDEKAAGTTVGVPTISATATLTIDAGTVIYGKVGAPGGALIVQRGSKIMAVGTADQPIVFTSEKAPTQRKSGDWSGVVICGKGINNIHGSLSTGTDGIEELEGGYGGFHGNGANSAADDNSGKLQYVRIEYGGYPINPNQELNGITFGSVGNGTTLDHIQVSYSNDDSFEWFGGTVNAKNLIAYKSLDDDFDTDNGFSGHVQFGIAIRDSNIADQSGSNGFECDNDATGTSNTPITAAQFSNMTIIGGKQAFNTVINLQFQNGAQIRRNAQEDIGNSIIVAMPNGIFIDNALGTPGTVANANAGSLVISKNIIAGVDKWGGNGFGSAANAAEQTALGLSVAGSDHPNAPKGRLIASGAGGFTNGTFGYNSGTSELQINGMAAAAWLAANNKVYPKWDNIGISASIFEPLNGAPALLPTAGSPALTEGTDFTAFSDSFFDKTVTYRGAFGTTDWTLGWVNWTPQTTDYSK